VSNFLRIERRRCSRHTRSLIHFYLGIRKWAQVPLPVWVEIQGFVGTVRLRVQLTPDAPFVGVSTKAGAPRSLAAADARGRM